MTRYRDPVHVALHMAVHRGDWDAAKNILDQHPALLNEDVASCELTPLQIAINSGHTHIVEELLELLPAENLLSTLDQAAGFENIRIAECILRKTNEGLSVLHRYNKRIPAVRAIYHGNIEMARYLYSVTPLEDLMPETSTNGATLMTQSIKNRSFDIALHLLLRCPRLALAIDEEGLSPLEALACIPSAFLSGSSLVFWKQWIYSSICIQPVTNEISVNIQNQENNQSHQVKITKSVLALLDRAVQNLLNFLGMIEPSTQLRGIPCAALQMQRELQWFKEVESIVSPKLKEDFNEDGLRPRELFKKNHTKMVEDGEKWMKDTSTSCTVVGALIVTIMFTASFTVPGGNNQDTGIPLFLEKKIFKLFIVSDAFSLFSSSISVLMFLGILTSRYEEDDFLKSLPTKFIIGLSTLFFSIATMMIAFSANLLIMLQGQSWMVIPVMCIVSILVTLLVRLQFPLLVDMFSSTYGPGIFNKKVKNWWPAPMDDPGFTWKT